MQEYYFLSEKNQCGPFTLEELKDKKLTSETLVWTDSMENWQKLKDIPYLLENLTHKKVPPPPPNAIKLKTEKAQNQILINVKPSNKVLRFFLIWSSIHLFALITSYSEINLFNASKPKTEEFWPFVKFVEPKYTQLTADVSFEEAQKLFAEKKFNGVFYCYDWSEFTVYICGALLIFIFLKLSGNDSKSIKYNENSELDSNQNELINDDDNEKQQRANFERKYNIKNE